MPKCFGIRVGIENRLENDTTDDTARFLKDNKSAGGGEMVSQLKTSRALAGATRTPPLFGANRLCAFKSILDALK